MILRGRSGPQTILPGRWKGRIMSIKKTSFARPLLACSASLGALAFAAGPALAQEDTGNEPIVVTGSRLITNGMESPIPITAVEAETLESMDPASLITSVSQLPQFYGNQTPNNSNFFVRGGTGNLNLRGLGINRSLTLLNGRRMASSSAFGGVDINLFPEAMISGIETVTGGASAAYGTDAVAGVVNFIIDTNFTGLELELQGGITSRNDGENMKASASWGGDIGDRGHVLLSATYASQEGIHSFEGRDWYDAWGSIQGADGIWRDYADVRSMNASFDGVIFAPGTAINGLQFNRNGGYAPYVPGTVTQGVLGTPPARSVGGSGDDLGGEVSTVWPETQRYSLFAYGDYELSDSLTVFAQYLRGYNHQFQYNTPRGSFGGTPTTATIFQDNAFLPDNLRQTMIDNDIASFTLRRMGSIEDIGQAYFEDWTTQNIGTVGFELDIDNDGGLLDGWSVDGFYQYGHSKRVWDQYALRVDRIFAALDAVRDPDTGQIVCNVSLTAGGQAAFPGCQPINLFGRGNASPQAIDYVLGNDVGQQVTTPLFFADSGFDLGETYSYTASQAKRNITTFQQHFAELTFAGNLFEGFGAGPIAMAVGASFRKDDIRQVVQDTTNPSSDHEAGRPVLCNDPTINLRGVSGPDCGNTVGFQYSKVSNIQGQSDVYEAFGEVLVPLVDTDGFSASANGALRWADYSGSGSIWAYKGGLEVGIADMFRLRGTYSRDVRAGNLSERFDKTGGAATVDDPRTPVQESINVTRFSGGNPNVRPEEADTFTAGAVFQPGFLPGFSASVDWYQVHIKDAIGQVGTQEVLRRCLIDNDPTFCDLVTLENDIPVLIGDVYVNVAESRVEGVDAELGYRTSVNLFGADDEELGFRAFASWLIERADVGASGTVTDLAGVTGLSPSTGAQGIFPDFKANLSANYIADGFSLFLQGRYIGAGIRDQNLTEGVDIEDNDVPDVFYLDARIGYEFPLSNANSVEFFLSATNLLDKDPPITPTYSAFLGYASQVNTGLFDVLGRRFTFGAKIKM